MDKHKEIEVRFLDIDKEAVIKKLKDLGAEDQGEVKLEQVIFYDKDITWRDKHKFVRIRRVNSKTELSYKHFKAEGEYVDTIEDVIDIGTQVEDFDAIKSILESIGLVPYRHEEKYRHTFILDGVTCDIDTWPKIPAYVELEGNSESDLKKLAEKIGFDWSEAFFGNAGMVAEKYGIDLLHSKVFKFDTIE